VFVTLLVVPCRQELRNVEGQLRGREQELTLLQDVKNQKLENLKQKSPDAHKVNQRRSHYKFVVKPLPPSLSGTSFIATKKKAGCLILGFPSHN
jgi:hypothetical protein